MIPYTSALPLRRSTAWGQFATDEVIPHRYGSISGSCVQYSADGRQWCWADHPCMSVDAVTVGGLPRQDWRALTALDRSNRAVTLVEFADPIDTAPVVTGRGKLSALTGQLLTNPADIVHDIVTQIAGNTLSASTLDAFRAECQGLPVGVEVRAGTLQRAVRSVCESIGAIFSPLHPGLCQLYPSGSYAGSTVLIDGRHRSLEVSATSVLEDIRTALVVAYAHVDGAGTASLEIDAPSAIERFGRVAADIDLPWCRDARTAYSVARRLLQHWARPCWRYGARNLPETLLSVGDVLDVSTVIVPAATAQAVRIELDYRGRSTDVALAQSWVGPAPTVRLVNSSVQFEPPSYPSIATASAGSDHVFTVLDSAGRPIPQAVVTIDRSIRRTADSGGIVRVPLAIMGAGQHHLLIEGAGLAPLEATVTV